MQKVLVFKRISHKNSLNKYELTDLNFKRSLSSLILCSDSNILFIYFKFSHNNHNDSAFYCVRKDWKNYNLWEKSTSLTQIMIHHFLLASTSCCFYSSYRYWRIFCFILFFYQRYVDVYRMPRVHKFYSSNILGQYQYRKRWKKM